MLSNTKMGNTMKSFKINKKVIGSLDDIIGKITFPTVFMYHPLMVSMNVGDDDVYNITVWFHIIFYVGLFI